MNGRLSDASMTVIVSTRTSATCQRSAHAMLPGRHAAEQRGTFTNFAKPCAARFTPGGRARVWEAYESEGGVARARDLGGRTRPRSVSMAATTARGRSRSDLGGGRFPRSAGIDLTTAWVPDGRPLAESAASGVGNGSCSWSNPCVKLCCS